VLRGYKKRGTVTKSGLKAKLIRHFEQYPDAKDTIIGIAQWWVSEDPQQVQMVLEEMVTKGLIGKKSFSSLVLYSLDLAFKKGKKK